MSFFLDHCQASRSKVHTARKLLMEWEVDALFDKSFRYDHGSIKQIKVTTEKVSGQVRSWKEREALCKVTKVPREVKRRRLEDESSEKEKSKTPGALEMIPKKDLELGAEDSGRVPSTRQHDPSLKESTENIIDIKNDFMSLK